MAVVCRAYSQRAGGSAPAGRAQRRPVRRTAQRAVVGDRDAALARSGVEGPRSHWRRRLRPAAAAEEQLHRQ